MRIPHFMPAWITGRQITNPGTGGPASHMDARAMAARSYPTLYRVGLFGLGAMSRHVMGPTMPTTANAYSDPRTASNLEIAGLMKAPRGG